MVILYGTMVLWHRVDYYYVHPIQCSIRVRGRPPSEDAEHPSALKRRVSCACVFTIQSWDWEPRTEQVQDLHESKTSTRGQKPTDCLPASWTPLYAISSYLVLTV